MFLRFPEFLKKTFHFRPQEKHITVSVLTACYTVFGDLSLYFSEFRSTNPFNPSAPFLYSLKTSENFIVFRCFQGVEKGYVGTKWVKKHVLPQNRNPPPLILYRYCQLDTFFNRIFKSLSQSIKNTLK